MKMIPVQSSNLKQVGFDPDRRELRVEFRSGNSHVHKDVSPEMFAGLMSADSHGSYYAKHISGKTAGHRAEPLPDERPRIDVAKRGRPILYSHGEPQELSPSDLDEAVRRFRGEC